jgi:hypothetical protein
MKKYLLQAVLLFVSFYLSVHLPATTSIKTLVALPGIGVLFSFLFDIFLVRFKLFSEILRKDKQYDFALGTGAHMASVAYDKHAQFCEEYIIAVEKTFDELTSNGTSKQTGMLVVPLVQIRRKYTAWLTSKLEKELIEYERILIDTGMSHMMMEFADENSKIEKYAENIGENLVSLLGNREKSVRESAVNHIRKILEIDTLADIRGVITEEAKNRLILNP